MLKLQLIIERQTANWNLSNILTHLNKVIPLVTGAHKIAKARTDEFHLKKKTNILWSKLCGSKIWGRSSCYIRRVPLPPIFGNYNNCLEEACQKLKKLPDVNFKMGRQNQFKNTEIVHVLKLLRFPLKN